MSKRVTSILRAGAVLDFDFGDLTIPTTINITSQVIDLKIRGLDSEESGLIRFIYDKIVEASRKEYRRMHPVINYYEPSISFEDLFDVIESLHSFSGTWKHEHYPFPLISTLVKSDLNYSPVDYYNAMVAIVERIIEIVSAYDKKFRDPGREQWYKDFWKGFAGELDVFNLNYDSTVEFSLSKFKDGFVPFTHNQVITEESVCKIEDLTDKFK